MLQTRRCAVLSSPTWTRRSSLARCAHATRQPTAHRPTEDVSPWQSTGYVVNFLVQYRAYARLMLLPVLVAVLIPLSKVARTLAVHLHLFRNACDYRTVEIIAHKIEEKVDCACAP